jgi:hypothetical protein
MGVFYRYQDSGLDDWKKENNYLQMGFRPGFAIQARELTQLQTIFQSQLSIIAKKVGMRNGSVIDAEVNLTGPQGGGSGLWNCSITPGHIWLQPELRDFAYAVHINEIKQLSTIPVEDGKTTVVYLFFEELQVNPNGDEHLPQGGFAGVVVDESLNDNAQGFTNYSAPGASRYRINITEPSYYIQGEGILPPQAVEIFYFENGYPYYSANGSPVTY